MGVDSTGRQARQSLSDSDSLPMEHRSNWLAVADQALDLCQQAFDRINGLRLIRLHGDCHPGNILWREEGDFAGPLFGDLDDACMGPAVQDFAGYDEHGSVYRFQLQARGEEARLDHSALPLRPSAAGRTAGALLKTITEDAAPGQFDTSAVSDVGAVGPMKLQAGMSWSEAARQIAGGARASWRVENGAVQLQPVGATVHTLSEADGNFSPDSLQLRAGARRGADRRCRDPSMPAR